MTCSNVKKRLALIAGGDLPARKERKLLAHIDRCPLCRQELEEYRGALRRVKDAARAEGLEDWTGAEWKALMTRVTVQKADRRKSAPFEPRPRWVLASGIAAVVLLALLTFLFRDSIFRFRGARPDQGTEVVKKEEPKGRPEQPPASMPADKEGKGVPIIQPEYFAKNAGKGKPSIGSSAKSAAGQDVISVTMVSKETGLQVVWFFNKNFEWKGDQK